jgi:hypothetical protein
LEDENGGMSGVSPPYWGDTSDITPFSYSKQQLLIHPLFPAT